MAVPSRSPASQRSNLPVFPEGALDEVEGRAAIGIARGPDIEPVVHHRVRLTEA